MAMTHPVSDGVEYQQRVDEDLVAIAKTGDNLAMEYLLNKYKNFVRIKAKSYFLIGVRKDTGEIIVTFYARQRRVIRRYRSKEAEPLVRAIEEDADSLALGKMQLAHLILELGRAEASLQQQPASYRQRLTA